jgi:hypothetical protein
MQYVERAGGEESGIMNWGESPGDKKLGAVWEEGGPLVWSEGEGAARCAVEGRRLGGSE